MALEKYTAQEVLELSRKNQFRAYPTPKRNKSMLFPFPVINSRARFTIEDDTKFFTMGSCFARNIERHLERLSFDVLSSSSKFFNPFPNRQDFHLFNKYTVHSVLNELKWAFEEMPVKQEEALFEISPGQFCDFQTGGSDLSSSYDDLLEFRKSYSEVFRNIAQADVVILTLGLVEAWYDNQAGIYLNVFPSQSVIRANPERFSLHVLDYAEIYSALEEIYRILARYNKNFNMLLTVSPVPLSATFRPQNVLTANSYSKTVQRAAVEEFTKNYPVDYFPSFETVTLSEARFAWSDNDYRHVRRTTVERILNQVLSNYAPRSEKYAAINTLTLSKSYLEAGYPELVKNQIEQHLKKFSASPELDLVTAKADIAMGNLDDAIKVLRSILRSVEKMKSDEELVLETVVSIRAQADKLLNDCLRFSDAKEETSDWNYEQRKAAQFVDKLLSEDPTSEELNWISNLLQLNMQPHTEQLSSSDKAYLVESTILAKMREAATSGDRKKEIEEAEKGLELVKFSDEIEWRLASLYRQEENLEAALSCFATIVRRGGKRSLSAYKQAVTLAKGLKLDGILVDLSESMLNIRNHE